MVLHNRIHSVTYCKWFAVCMDKFYADNGFGEYIRTDSALISFFQASGLYVV